MPVHFDWLHIQEFAEMVYGLNTKTLDGGAGDSRTFLRIVAASRGMSPFLGRSVLLPYRVPLYLTVSGTLAEEKNMGMLSCGCILKRERKKLQKSAGVAKYSYSSSCYNAYALTQGQGCGSFRRVYGRIASMEHLARVQPPQIAGNVRANICGWLKTRWQDVAVTSNTTASEPNKQDRMRQWLNYGINTKMMNLVQNRSKPCANNYGHVRAIKKSHEEKWKCARTNQRAASRIRENGRWIL